MKSILLTQGFSTKVDDIDFESVSQHCWWVDRVGRNFYARTKIDGVAVRLHTFLMRPDRGAEVDHRDGDGLNNLRSNLRVVSHMGNMRGKQKKSPGKSSRYRGVSWHKATNKWMAYLKENRRRYYLGLFDSEKAAAAAFNREAFKRGWLPECFNPCE